MSDPVVPLRDGPVDKALALGLWGAGLAWLTPMMLSMMASGGVLGHTTSTA